VDVVVIIDRTASMDTHSGAVQATRDAAKAILGVYDPAKQRVALGLLGPSSSNSTCAGLGGPDVAVNYQVTGTLTAPAYASDTSQVTSTAATTLGIGRPSGTATGDLLVAGITFAGGTGTLIPPANVPTGWTLIKRADNTTNVGMATYYKVAGSSEPATYTWTFSTSVRASGGIVRYTGANTSDPIDTFNLATGNDTTSPFRVTTPSVTTSTNQEALVGFYGIGAKATWTASSGLTEQFDAQNMNAAGPSSEGSTGTQATAGTTSAANNATATAGGQFVSQLVALNPKPVDTYGTDPATNLNNWIPIGFTGTDTDSPNPANSEAYSDTSGGVKPYPLVNGSHVVSAINCFDSGYMGTNLATPVAMATYYLQHYGRPNVTWGILLETDGYPQYVTGSDPNNYTCWAASNAAIAAKNTLNHPGGTPIQIFTVGFGLDSGVQDCGDGSGTADTLGKTWHSQTVNSLLASMATGPSVDGGCPGTSNTDGDHYFCEPYTSQLAGIFAIIAQQLQTTRAHLVQLYPAPIVTSVGTGTSVTIGGQYFTGLSKVTFGGLSATYLPTFTDGSITATAPCATCHGGTPVDVVVTTAGGTSTVTTVSKYTYPP